LSQDSTHPNPNNGLSEVSLEWALAQLQSIPRLGSYANPYILSPPIYELGVAAGWIVDGKVDWDKLSEWEKGTNTSE
jgi:hypothetical protein